MKGIFFTTLAVAYWLWPLDLVPDVPPIGYVDDLAVGAASVVMAFWRGRK